jgi:hypothetical protein|tara:strand:+ start:3432 stop:3686 length:255 start_codon:yes stop_codon:yes gene_type:complete
VAYRYVRKSSEDALNLALDKLVMVCPNKKTYDELTSLMFQLYCGNDFGLGNFSLTFLDRVEDRWRSGRKKAASAKGLKLVVKNA